MNILEKEIEDLIWEGIRRDPDLMNEKGLPVHKDFTYARQVSLGSYGIADIVGYLICPKSYGTRNVYVRVIEIKKDEVNQETLTQAARYATAIKRLLQESLNECVIHIGISLIGRWIEDKTEFCFYSNVFDNLSFYTYQLDFKHGITFQRMRDYYQSDEKLPNHSPYLNNILQSLQKQINPDCKKYDDAAF